MSVNGVRISDDDERWRMPGRTFCEFAAELFVLSTVAQKVKCRTFEGLSIDIRLVSNAIHTLHPGIFQTECHDGRRWRSDQFS